MIDQTKYKNKYRIASSRLQSWDYSWNGAYFITICTKDREHYFGDISNGIMQLSHVGVLADVFWYEIKNHATNIARGDVACGRDVACNVSTTTTTTIVVEK